MWQMEHPGPGVVGDHVCGHHLRLHEFNNVSALSILQHDIAVPMGSVNTELFPQCNQIPTDTLAFFHGHHGAGSVDVAVDGESRVSHKKAASPDTGIFAKLALECGGRREDMQPNCPQIVS